MAQQDIFLSNNTYQYARHRADENFMTFSAFIRSLIVKDSKQLMPSPVIDPPVTGESPGNIKQMKGTCITMQPVLKQFSISRARTGGVSFSGYVRFLINEDRIAKRVN